MKSQGMKSHHSQPYNSPDFSDTIQPFFGGKKNQPWWLLKPTMATPGGPSGNDDQGDKVRTEFGFLLDQRNLSVILPSLG
jgi:hypothetical protein